MPRPRPAEGVHKKENEDQDTWLRFAMRRSRAKRTNGGALAATLVLLSVPSSASIECAYGGNGMVLPCTFGGCTFLDGGGGVLHRTGSCPDHEGNLYLNQRGITGLSDGVFDNMGSCYELFLQTNSLSALSPNSFQGVSNINALFLNTNELSALGRDTFAGLSLLKQLYLNDNDLAPESIHQDTFAGLPSLKCASFIFRVHLVLRLSFSPPFDVTACAALLSCEECILIQAWTWIAGTGI